MRISRLLILLCVCIQFSNAYEKILLFDEKIKVRQDGWIDVEERITVNAEGINIRHGIVREMALRHRTSGVLNSFPKFKLTSVLRDGYPTPYDIKEVYNGKHIYIRDPAVWLRHGKYTFTIKYSTRKHIGFFKKHDELYWNVTGRWRLPIMKAKVEIVLPAGVQAQDIKTEAYVDQYGGRGSDYNVSVNNNKVFFNTTKPLYSNQEMTIVVGWPKGFVQQPTSWENAQELFLDNLYILIVLLGILAILFLMWLFSRSDRVVEGTIIPLYAPPKDFTPSMCRYLLNYKSDKVGFASKIVQMAVNGMLRIEQKKKTFGWGKEYVLIQLIRDKGTVLGKRLFAILFKTTTKLKLVASNQKTLLEAMTLVKHYDNDHINDYFDYRVSWLAGAGFIVVLSLLGAGMLRAQFIELVVVAVLMIVALIIPFYFMLRGYTQEGQDLADQVKGFQLFLRTAETERLKIMAPVDKSPELYERFLPYAIALDAEEQWTRAFAPIFEKFDFDGHPYHPIWWGGRGFDSSFSGSSFSNSISSFASTLHTTATPTGSSGFSGGGGGGSAGGGGGGGGGGGC